jgi:Exostosin family
MSAVSCGMLVAWAAALALAASVDCAAPSTVGSVLNHANKHARRAGVAWRGRQERDSNGHNRTPRIFVYELPALYNVAMLDAPGYPDSQLPHTTLNTNCREFTESVEIYLHEAILNSEFAVSDPATADFFFIPVYSFCAYTRYDPWTNFTAASSNVTAFIQSLFDHLDTDPRLQDPALNVSYLRRHGAADHVIVLPGSHGASYFTTSMSDAWAGVWMQLIGVNMFGEVTDIRHAPFPLNRMNPIRDIVIPSPVSKPVRSYVERKGGLQAAHGAGTTERNGRAFFAGTNTSLVRAQIEKFCAGKPGFDVQMRALAPIEYISYMTESTYCLVPRGHSGWTMRLFDAVACGCIPVIISDNQMLPFGDTLVDWSTFSIKVPENSVHTIEHVLQNVPADTVKAMQKALLKAAPNMWYTDPAGTEGHDAVWAVMQELEARGRLYRGHGRQFWGG